MKKVLLITTGGTIASRDTKRGMTPQLSANQLLDYMPELMRLYDVDTRDLLNLDSSNIQADEWQIIARAVFSALDKYDGVIITHGTDTMAYSASMLCFMLYNLKKPVIFTGSQTPIEDLLTDARNNLFTAFSAVEAGIPGVAIAFNRKIINGCRAVKVRTMGFDAFESVNASYLGEVYSTGMRMHMEYAVKPDFNSPTKLLDNVCRDIFLLKLIPGTKPQVFDMLKNMGYRGIVLEAFGLGGMQSRRSLLDKLKMLTASGIAVVACSQCLYETSDFTVYEAGRKLLDCGVIPGRDMTSEAAVTKLMWALGQTSDLNLIRKMFETSYAGEIDLS